ncbi:MAG: hypothetical protein KME08_19270 [Aphanothece sp. CMT-3BRIN-NPC111]|jgi:tetratricopeptide (TPR) repeat protein|nr:hypothetical protein [Aphanothece sp. CMT-3BRIN-NPC111]
MDELFAKANLEWDLEALYTDLASLKGPKLTKSQKPILLGLLSGYNPTAIAAKIHWTPAALRVELTKVYKQIAALVGEEKIVWHRVADSLERAGYKRPRLKVFKEDLVELKLLSSQSFNSKIITASKIIAVIKPILSHPQMADKSSAEILIKQGDRSAKQGNFSEAITFYKDGFIKSPSLNGLIKIARCYDRLLSYHNSLFIYDFALQFAQKNRHKKQIYYFIARIFYELSLSNYNDFYVKLSYDFYQQSLYYSPFDVLLNWDIVNLFISVFTAYPNASEAHKNYVDNAERALYLFKSIASRPEFNFKLYKEAILQDVERLSQGLDERLKKQLNELKSF